MNTRKRIAFVCYLLPALGLAGFGLVYFFSPRIMSYHEVAIGVSWLDLESSFQVLLLALLKASGAGFLGASLALGILLFIPFRRGDSWARWAIFAIGLSLILPLIYTVLFVKLGTPASPPLLIPIAGAILLIVGLVLSTGLEKESDNSDLDHGLRLD